MFHFYFLWTCHPICRLTLNLKYYTKSISVHYLIQILFKFSFICHFILPIFFVAFLTTFCLTPNPLDSLFQVHGPPLKQIQPMNNKPSTPPSHQQNAPRRTPSAPSNLIREQVMQHLQQRKQQQRVQPSSQQDSRKNSAPPQDISRQLKASQEAGQEARGRKPNPMIIKAVSSENLARPPKMEPRRSSISPCHRIDVDDYDELLFSTSPDCQITVEEFDLSKSAPEWSLREQMPREQRSKSVPFSNLLKVPQGPWALPLITFSSDESVCTPRSSSFIDLSSSTPAELLRQGIYPPIWRSKSCGLLITPLKKPKKSVSMAEPLRTFLNWLTPRSSPRSSPGSSRSSSPSARRSSMGSVLFFQNENSSLIH